MLQKHVAHLMGGPRDGYIHPVPLESDGAPDIALIVAGFDVELDFAGNIVSETEIDYIYVREAEPRSESDAIVVWHYVHEPPIR